MNHAGVMDEVAARLESVTGLRVFAWPPGTVTPPAAIVGYPTEFTFDETYGRGMDTVALPVIVVLGRPTDRSTRDAIAEFTAGGGPRAVRQVLGAGPWSAFHTCRVAGGEYDVYTVGATDYLAAIFDLRITGQGR